MRPHRTPVPFEWRRRYRLAARSSSDFLVVMSTARQRMRRPATAQLVSGLEDPQADSLSHLLRELEVGRDAGVRVEVEVDHVQKVYLVE